MSENPTPEFVPGEIIQLEATGALGLMCLACVGALVEYEAKEAAGKLQEGDERPEVRPAVTLAPSWQQTQTFGQLMMTCVALPTCKEHIVMQEMSALAKAVQGGRLLPGGAG